MWSRAEPAAVHLASIERPCNARRSILRSGVSKGDSDCGKVVYYCAMLCLCLLLLFAAAPALAQEVTPQGQQQAAPPTAKALDCYCTDRQHNRVELGEVICMQVDGRMFTARCEMSLNNPMWREIDEGCASSGLWSTPAASGAL